MSSANESPALVPAATLGSKVRAPASFPVVEDLCRRLVGIQLAPRNLVDVPVEAAARLLVRHHVMDEATLEELQEFRLGASTAPVGQLAGFLEEPEVVLHRADEFRDPLVVGRDRPQ